ncbi:MAG: nucleotide exchange factor GrpE [Verrucomicrobia bacterium]|nr:nucleotide exchange factor GrpE [Verrucomicrobiota bacterium]
MKKTEPKPADEIPASTGEATPAAEEVTDFQAEAARFKDLALRAQADLDNYRKRAIRDKEDSIRYANSSLLEKLLPVLDNFELGLEAARSAPDTASIVQGMAMVEKQLQDFLKSQGVEAIPAEGEVFDPARHEAVAQEHSAVPEGHVVRLLRKGYKLKDRLLRASSVTVSKGAAE